MEQPPRVKTLRPSFPWLISQLSSPEGNRAFRFALAVLVGTISTSSTAWTDGFRNPFQNAAAIRQATAFAAQADDPSAIHYNPADMKQLSGVQIAGGLQFLAPHTKFTNASGMTTRDEWAVRTTTSYGTVHVFTATPKSHQS